MLDDIPIHELYKSPNGGISLCLHFLAQWMVHDGVEEVLRELEEAYAMEENKRVRDCLCFLIDGISSIDRELIHERIESIQLLLPGLLVSNNSYKERFESMEMVLDEWKVAAESAGRLLEDWRRWIFKNEQLRLGGITTGHALRVMSQPRFQAMIFAPKIDSPMSFRAGREYFSKTVEAVNQAIKHGHLANRLPADLDVRDFRIALKNLFAQQEIYEKLTADDQDLVLKDNELWETYHSQINALIQVLWTMDEVHLWSLFWLVHPAYIERAAL